MFVGRQSSGEGEMQRPDEEVNPLTKSNKPTRAAATGNFACDNRNGPRAGRGGRSIDKQIIGNAGARGLGSSSTERPNQRKK
jgi:hypothetical protein